MDKVLRSYRTVVQMLKDRNFSVDIELQEDKMIALLKEEIEGILFTRGGDKITVRYYESFTREKIEKISLLAVNSKEKKVHFLVFCKKLDPKVQPYLTAIDKKVYIEAFPLEMLVFPIVNHVHVPSHRKLTEQEVEDLFEYYKIPKKYEEEEVVEEVAMLKPVVSSRRRPQRKFEEEEVEVKKKDVEKPKRQEVMSYDKGAILKKFPILLLSDPVARYYDFQPFDMVVIDEHNSPYIRVVFDNLKSNK